MRFRAVFLLLALSVVQLLATKPLAAVPPTAEQPWRALHVINYTTDERLEGLAQAIAATGQDGHQLPDSRSELRLRVPIASGAAAGRAADHQSRRRANAGRVPRERHRAGAAVHVPGAPVVGQEHVSAAHEVSGARSDARRVSRQQRHLLPRVGPDESEDERDRLRADRRADRRLRGQGVSRRHGRSVSC